MLWPRHTCPFGLPDDADCAENIVLLAIGYSIREASTDITDAPLPAGLVALLRKLEMQEQALPAAKPVGRRHHVRRRRHDRPLAGLRPTTAVTEPAMTTAASA